ncbi:MAG TPA: hypothetical protein VI248_26190 [Kineosporiaceae bacterium]
MDPAPRRRGRGRGALAVGMVVMLGMAGFAGWAWWTGSIAGVPVRPHCTSTAGGATAELDPEQAGNAATIAAVAVRRGLPGRAATIAIATALQESKLVNVPGGDRDSVGLFQQRPSQGWGTAEQVHDPVYASNAFYDVLVKIEGYQNLPITQAAQKVQRSAFPSAYAEHEPEARSWASTLTGYSPAGLSCVLPASRGGATQSPGANGLTPPATTLVRAASAATGRTGTPVAGSGGSAVRFAAGAKGDTRAAWALAQWAVARADDLDVVAVEVDGRQWRRADSTAGWTALPNGPPAGTVIVRVAAP